MTMAGTYGRSSSLDDMNRCGPSTRRSSRSHHIDTAQMYRPFHREEIVCAPIEDPGDHMVMTTRFGLFSTPAADPSSTAAPDIRATVEGSLTRPSSTPSRARGGRAP